MNLHNILEVCFIFYFFDECLVVNGEILNLVLFTSLGMAEEGRVRLRTRCIIRSRSERAANLVLMLGLIET